MSGRCGVCGSRGAHIGGCPVTTGAGIRDRVQRIVGDSRSAPAPLEWPPVDAASTLRLGQKVLGYRQWRLDGYRLQPAVTFKGGHWQPGPNTARCVREPPAGRPVGEHCTPDPACECGLYALHYPPGQPSFGPTVSGAVLAWGRIEVHAEGFRAEHAEPVVLAYDWRQPPEHLEALRAFASEFYLPVVEHRELVAAAAGLGQVISPELRPPHCPGPNNPPLRANVGMRMSLGEELLVVALCADNDGWVVGSDGMPRVPAGMGFVMAGAMLAELALLGRIACSGKHVEAVSNASTGDPRLDRVLCSIAESSKPRAGSWWVLEIAQTKSNLEGLWRPQRSGLIREYERPERGLFGTKRAKRWFIPELGPEAPILEHWHGALNTGAADARTVAMLGLARASGMHRVWFGHLSRRELRRRLRPIVRKSWVDRAVDGAIGSHCAMSAPANGSL